MNKFELPPIVKRPIKILRTPSGYKVVDANGVSVCYVYEGNRVCDPLALSDDDARAIAQTIARALST